MHPLAGHIFYLSSLFVCFLEKNFGGNEMHKNTNTDTSINPSIAPNGYEIHFDNPVIYEILQDQSQWI
jgi:hypothetical protein